MKDAAAIIAENARRRALLDSPYDPRTGQGSDCIPRTLTHIPDAPLPDLYLPDTFLSSISPDLLKHGVTALLRQRCKNIPTVDIPTEVKRFYQHFDRERCRHDFEFWAYGAIKIKGKASGGLVPFRLNIPQRRLLKVFEEQRLANQPIRVVLLKARQWGGSTLTQIYMLWIQLMHKQSWDSFICGAIESQSRNVRAMITRAAENYPSALSSDFRFKPFEGSQKNKYIPSRNCTIFIGSLEKPDSIRSADISMAHLTEVGLWPVTDGKRPEDIVQSVLGTIPELPYTVFVIESTAKGVGNYFHTTWNAAVEGRNNLRPVFVEWFTTPLNSKPIPDGGYGDFIASLNDYESYLWELGATLEAINWYRLKASSPGMDPHRMNSEFPSTPTEAFQSTGRRVFPIEDVQKTRRSCHPPEYTGHIIADAQYGTDALRNVRFIPDKAPDVSLSERLWVWIRPCLPEESFTDRYIVSVDIGGRSTHSDPSDILVLDRYWMREDPGAGVPEVVAEWHGHIDLDLLAWKAAQIATFYHGALLVVESNTAETNRTEGNQFETILDEIVHHYPNLYCRTSPQQIHEGLPQRWGFHTNTQTKPLIVNHQVRMLRERGYIERCAAACDEFDCFEVKENGRSTGAVEGSHDDRVMARCIANYIAWTWPLRTKADDLAYRRLLTGGAPYIPGALSSF
jgi:hypothetical protein